VCGVRRSRSCAGIENGVVVPPFGRGVSLLLAGAPAVTAMGAGQIGRCAVVGVVASPQWQAFAGLGVCAVCRRAARWGGKRTATPQRVSVCVCVVAYRAHTRQDVRETGGCRDETRPGSGMPRARPHRACLLPGVVLQSNHPGMVLQKAGGTATMLPRRGYRLWWQCAGVGVGGVVAGPYAGRPSGSG